MSFDKWSVWGVRKNNKDLVFVNIDEHKISQLGNKFAHFIVQQYINDELSTLNNAVDNTRQNGTIVTPETTIDKNGNRWLRKLASSEKLNNHENLKLMFWGAFFGQESYNPNFLLQTMHYYMNNNGYLLLSDLTCYAYIYNLDTNKFEIYYGFNKELGIGRYGKIKHDFIPSHCYGVSLAYEFDIKDLVEFAQSRTQEKQDETKECVTDWNLEEIAPDNGKEDW